ncbi:MAG: HAD-IA family hydrolase [Gammaproteobacteria bacterium]|nr:HAD-IA family hydrolase [Gammaproteobacteria bacterium]MCW8986390.1 HAD-IA family hydrolase [Gammaproteobacteria bacterium]MCW9031057.1 HAD-IA family hydrolase [Gammaproteobacteria bacterium]
MQKIKTVLFDLDGTLADTAPDLANALNYVLEKHNYTALPYEKIRPVVSHGGMALVTLGFGADHPEFDTFYKELLEHYQNNIANETTLFPGMDELLLALEKENINWGVVTNKPGWLTKPLMEALNLTSRAATIVSGDTLEERKPHPAPLLHACQQAGSKAEECIYVGDAERDIEAGNRAGMLSLVALFGYIADSDVPETWGAHSLITSPAAIIPLIQSLN